MSEMDRFPMFTGHPAPDVPECRCGDGATLRGYIKTYGETPAMTASNREHWKRRAEAAEAKLAARPETAAPTPAPTADVFKRVCEAFWNLQNGNDCWCDTGDGNPHTMACLEARGVTADAKRAYDAALSSPVGETPAQEGRCLRCGHYHLDGATCGFHQCGCVGENDRDYFVSTPGETPADRKEPTS